MRPPRFIRRWLRRRDQLRQSRLTRLWQQFRAPFVRGWRWLNEARAKRSLRNLWWGLPAAVLAMTAVGLVTAAQLKTSDSELVYRTLAIRSYRAGDFDKARVFLERVYRAGDSSQETRFFLANTLEGQGETKRSRALVESLAPDTGDYGYPNAHLLKARWLLSPNSFVSEQHERLALRHLTAAAEKFQDQAEWLYLKAKFCLMRSDTDTAIELLSKAARQNPAYLIDLARVSRRLNLPETDQRLDAAMQHLRKILAQNESDHEARISLGLLLSDAGEFDQAFRILNDGLSIHPEGQFQRALADLCLAHYDTLLAETDTQPDVRLKLLQNALKYNPRSLEAVRRLAFFGEEGGSTEETRERARTFLHAMVASGLESPIAHLALGTKAWHDGNSKQATFHLRRAYELNPDMSVLANNLAWVLAHDEDAGDPERALQIIDSLLEDFPDVPNFRDTRGHVLVQLKRWDEALGDLEWALRRMPDNAGTHEALQKVYTHIDPPNRELAEMHGRIAAGLRKQQGSLGKTDN